MEETNLREKVMGGLVGLCVGDALGVPVEFVTREELKVHPVTDMMGYGIHSQPPGTWSDDSSMALCLAESLCKGFDVEDISASFVRWWFEGHWTPHGKPFDIGITTIGAIRRLNEGISPAESGDTQRDSNGSLMRILPLAFYLHKHKDLPPFEYTHIVSRITHAHPRAQMACGIYINLALHLLDGCSPYEAYRRMREDCINHYSSTVPFRNHLAKFQRVLEGNVWDLAEEDISSGGNAVECLEAALWSFLKSGGYSEAVLTAVNLGEDTDTTGAVAGGLAGVYYGYDGIPKKWVESLARAEDIIRLSEELYGSLYPNGE